MLTNQLSKLQRIWLVASATTWVCAILLGFGIFMNYENTPGKAARSKSIWPAGSNLSYSRQVSTLIMVLHPRCPCSRASLEHLSMIMDKCKNKLKVQVLFFVPSGFEAKWQETDIWKQAAEIPEIELLCDRDGLVAQKFGAATSGQTYIYDQSGVLKFSGGITAARGQVGENNNLELAYAALRNETGSSVLTAVYGCPINDSVRK